jgi:outer membrane immunogenic protein
MKRILFASLAVATLASGTAVAADLPAPAQQPVYYKAPPPLAPNWTGFYLTAGGGYGMWTADTTTLNPTTGVCVLCVTQTQGGNGWFGRAGGGYDYQFGLPLGQWTPQVLIGPMADYDFSSLTGTVQDQGPFFAGSMKETWSWAAGARIGFIPSPNFLSYINSGFTQTHFDAATMTSTFTGAGTGFSTSPTTASGWFLGGGIESPLNFILPAGWFLRSEYRYAYYPTQTLTDTCAAGCTFPSPQNNITFKPTVQTISTQIVYKFNWLP